MNWLQKLITALKTKRVQGVVIFALIWILGIFGVGVDEASTIEAYMQLIQVLSGIWHIYGWVDAFKGITTLRNRIVLNKTKENI